MRAICLIVLVSACLPEPKGGGGDPLPPPTATTATPTTPATTPPTTLVTTPSAPTTPPVSTTPTDTTADDWQPVTYIDQGYLCFEQREPDMVLEVVAPDCLSGSCTQDVSGTCSVVVAGSDITVTSEITWSEYFGPNGCTDDCNWAAVECVVPALADGTYTVHIGGRTEELVVPVADCGYYPGYY